MQALTNPKFNWDSGLRQADLMASMLQKNKLEAKGVGDVWRSLTRDSKELANQQARLANASARGGANGMLQMYIPANKELKNLVGSSEMFHRQLSIQGEMLGAVGAKVQNWGKNMQWAGRQLMVGFTIPFAAAAAAAGVFAFQVDQQLTRIEKVYDGSTKGLRQMAMDTSKAITQTMGTSTRDNLDVMAQLAAVGQKGIDLQRGTAEVQRLTTLGEMDRLQSLQAVITLQSTFRMNTQETADAINYMNAVENATSLSMQDFAQALPIAAAPVAELGGNIKELGTVMVAMKERGIDAGEGANAIKTLMTRVINPTKEVQELFQQLTGKDLKEFVKSTGGKLMPTLSGLAETIKNSNLSLLDQQRLVSELGGAYQATRLTSILQGLASEGGQVAKAMEVAGQSTGQLASTAQRELSKQVGSISGQFKIALSGFQTELQAFGEIALQAATNVLNIGKSILNFINSLPGWIKQVLGVGFTIAAIAGPLVMIVGLIGNLIGTMGKGFGALMRMSGGYRSMTIQQKASELATGNLSSKLLSQAESAQILIFQLEKLQAAYLTTSSQAQKMAMLPNNPAIWQIPSRQAGLSMPLNYKPPAGGNPMLGGDAWNVQSMVAANAAGLKTVADETEKASRFQKIFRQETMLGASAIAGVASLASDANSSFGKWATGISIATALLGTAWPLVQKIGTAVKNSSLVQSITSGVSNATGKAGSAIGKLGSMFSAAGRAIFSPWSLGIAAVGFGLFGLFKLINSGQAENLEKQRQLTNSTEGWAKALGFVQIKMGQVRNEAGGVEDTFQALVEKQKSDNKPVVEAFKESNYDKLYDRIRKEIYKLQAQGIDSGQIEAGIKAALVAAGRTKDDIEKIMSHIKVDLDFTETKKTTDKFLLDTKNNIADIAKDQKGFKWYRGQFEEIGDMNRAKLAENAKLFYEKLNTLDPAQQSYLVKQMQKQYDDIQNEYFNYLKSKRKNLEKYGNFGEALNDLADFDPSKGFQVKDSKRGTPGAVDIVGAANATREYAIEIGKLYNISGPALENIKNFNDLMPHIKVNSMTATDATSAYNTAVKKLEASGTKLTDQQKLELAQIYATAGGLDAAKLAAGGYNSAQKDVGISAEENAKRLGLFITALKGARNEQQLFSSTITSTDQSGWGALGAEAKDQAKTLTSAVKEVYSGTMGTIYDSFAAQMEEQFTARMDRIQAGFERRRNALEMQSKALDKSWDSRMTAFKDNWDNIMDSTKKQYEQRKKDIENQSKAQVDAIDAQIQAIENQQKAEQEVEDLRQKMFEAEQRRIERLNELSNANIDFNRALAEGNLDEAARVQNNVSARQAGWRSEDAALESSDRLAEKDKERQKQIDELQKRKNQIQEEKQLKLDALQEEEKAVEQSLQRQREMQQRALEAQREIEKERLQNKMDALSKEQQAVEATERRKQEMNRRTLEIELATLKAFVPQNEQELNAHIGRVQGAYGNHGIELTIKGGQWGQIIGNALQSNVDRARAEMSNDAAWNAFGGSVANAITQGAFGLNLGDFFNMITTGKPPAGWKGPGNHAGGMAGYGGRAGRTGPLYNDEFFALLQKGEYVINRDAVSKLGTGYLDALNSGKTSGFAVGGKGGPENQVGMAGIFGSMLGYTMNQMIRSTFLGTGEQQATGFTGNISGKAGMYGNVRLTDEQINNANVIASVGKSMGASARDIVIALMTAMQESTLRNLNYGDRDSLGLFQQRPSQGWGSPDQVRDPVYASKKFFSSLFGVKNRNTMPLTLAAQAVQRSAFPHAYAKWQSMAESLMGIVGTGTIDSGLPGFGMFANMIAQITGNSGPMPGMMSGSFMKPVNGRVTSEYGIRKDPITGRLTTHDGIDIGAVSGTPIYAVSNGRVISAGFNSGGFGNWTLIDHGGGLISGYAHQSGLNVRAGQNVGRGQVIGWVGSTGRSTGPHLHFQMGAGPGRFSNPRQWIPGLKDGGSILYDNTLANLHRKETVLTAPLSSKLEQGINNLDKVQQGDINYINIEFNGETAGLTKQDVIDGVVEAMERKQRDKDKRLGRRP
jgi:TP901 family phage tail tape measure protein